MGVLDGVRVLDFGVALAGPWAIQQLAYMGAEVIRVESRRRMDPFFRAGGDRQGNFRPVDPLTGSVGFVATRVNQLSVTIHLKEPRGLELAKRLVAVSDVVGENLRCGVIDRLGLGYRDLVKVKPDIIMFSSSAWGRDVPNAAYAGMAYHFAALSGLADLTGYPDGAPSEMRGAVDATNGITGTVAILAALHHRQRTGEGQYIDMSQVEALSCLVGEAFVDYGMNARVPTRKANRDELMAPHNCYRCQGDDAWVSIVVATDEEWQALCQTVGHPEWAENPRFADAPSRRQNQAELDRLIEGWTSQRIPTEVAETLQKAGVAATPSYSADALFADPHVAARGVTDLVEHPVLGPTVVFAPPWKFSAAPAKVTRPAPLFGQHNNYIFCDLLGLSSRDMKRLVEEKVVH